MSRVGGNAQTKIIKKLGGGVRLALAQYRELAAFAQFASDLDEATRKQLDRGRLVTELMKQPQYEPLQVNEMAVTLFAVNKGYFDDVPVEKALAFESALRAYLKSKYAALMDNIEKTKDLSADDEKALSAAVEDFKKNGAYSIRGREAMAGAKEIRNKIKSVQSTRKITKAMEMVAASKMKKAQDRMRASRPYVERALQIAMHVAKANTEYKHPFLRRSETVRRVGAIVVTTDKGLCGGLNTNILRLVLNQHKEWRAKGLEVDYCAIGTKGLAFLTRMGAQRRLARGSAGRPAASSTCWSGRSRSCSTST